MQRKALAILYVLALEGPTRRERLADLLWGHRQALRNLRVELHGLNKVLDRHGLAGFPAGQDPLVLPDDIDLDRSPGAREDALALEGLEGLSRRFHAWLEAQRSRLEPSNVVGSPFATLVDEVAAELRAPFVVIVEGLPLSGRTAFARALAARLELPFFENVGAGGRGLHFVRDKGGHEPELVERIVEDRTGVWVIERSAFGEDPQLVLSLREALPASRIRYVKIPALDWTTARGTVLSELSFDDAARVFVATGGVHGYMEEMLALRHAEGFGDALPLPQKVAATFQLEARRLSLEARYALERLSVQPCRIDHVLIDVLGASEHVPELERRRWLMFQDGWRWAHEAARRVLYARIPLGQRLRYHMQAAERLEAAGHVNAARYHVWCADRRSVPLDGPVRSLDPSDPFASSLVHVPNDWRPVVPDDLDADVVHLDGSLSLGRALGASSSGVARFRVPTTRNLVRLRGAVYWDAPLSCDGRPAAMRVDVVDGSGPGLVLTPTVDAPCVRNGDLLHPANRRFDVWLLAPAGATVDISANDAGLVADMSIEAAVARRLDGETVEAMEAFEMTRPLSGTPWRPGPPASTWSTE